MNYSDRCPQDRTLEKMNAEDLKSALRPKTLGTQNLVEALEDLTFDFFIMFSSCASVVGFRGQANYAAGNAYQDSLAYDNTRTNAHYMSLNLGIVEDSEVVRLHPERLDALIRAGYIAVKLEDLFRLLEYSMSPKARENDSRQIAIGFNRRSLSGKDCQSVLRNPVFSHLPCELNKASPKVKTEIVTNINVALEAATNIHEVYGVLAAFIGKKMSALVSLNNDEIGLSYPIASLGLDSLIAIELKNWIVHTFRAPIQASEILDSRNIEALAKIVAQRSTLVTHRLGAQPDTSNQSDVSTRQLPIRTRKQLPTIPLPELADSLDQYLYSIRSFCSDKDIHRISSAIAQFQGPDGTGHELHSRLVARTKNPQLDNWLSDLYTIDVWTRRRDPLNPFGHYFGCYAASLPQQSQARRAAIISKAAFDFKLRSEAGDVEQDYLHEQPLDMELQKYIFNCHLEARVGVDKIRTHPNENYVVALRNGHFFSIALDIKQSHRDLENEFQAVLDRSTDKMPSIATLTADVRDSWAEVCLIYSECRNTSTDSIEGTRCSRSCQYNKSIIVEHDRVSRISRLPRRQLSNHFKRALQPIPL